MRYNQIPHFEKQKMQQTNRMKIFTKFTQGIQGLITKATMEESHQKYYIREFKIWEIDASMAVNLYMGIVTRAKRMSMDKNSYRWLENELRIFVWTLVFYALSKNIDIAHMTNEDWEFFTELFPNKQKILFQYQATSLLKNHNQYKKWTHEEDELFQRLVKKDNKRLRWSELGKALFIESDREYFRTSKQCRERWLNHLDPSKMKKYWLEAEDFVLVEYVKYYGKKWALISKKLESKRNQHSIKNRFKSLLTKQSKLCQQVCSENFLVDRIYYKLLKSLSQKKEQSHNQENNEIKEKNRMSSGAEGQLYEEYPNQSYNFGSHHSSHSVQNLDDIYDYQEANSIMLENDEKDILGNRCINSMPRSPEVRHSKSNVTPQNDNSRQVFEMTRIALDVPERKQSNNEKQAPNEMEKMVRADLFLQEDPFELLKSYFYKGSQ